jgi:cell division protein ZipA
LGCITKCWLKWGDGDLFNWENTNRDYGDDQFFSVATTTDPGYFLPESIKNGQMNPNDLVFGVSIPRNSDPQNVFFAMVEAVKYCQKRLGGKILDKNQQPFDESEAKKNLALLIKKMKNNGVVPGSYKALMAY